MSETTKRYRIDGTHGEYGRWTYNGMEPDESGQWVKYDDHIDALAAAQRENERLRYALEGLVDDEECRFDHHGNCQTHYLGNPCEMATARAVLRGEEANG